MSMLQALFDIINLLYGKTNLCKHLNNDVRFWKKSLNATAKAYPGPDLRIVAAKVADQSRKTSRKVAEGCATKKKDVM
jgi:hypothetical protein